MSHRISSVRVDYYSFLVSHGADANAKADDYQSPSDLLQNPTFHLSPLSQFASLPPLPLSPLSSPTSPASSSLPGSLALPPLLPNSKYELEKGLPKSEGEEEDEEEMLRLEVMDSLELLRARIVILKCKVDGKNFSNVEKKSPTKRRRGSRLPKGKVRAKDMEKEKEKEKEKKEKEKGQERQNERERMREQTHGYIRLISQILMSKR
jgi:hypothetical protein